MFFFILRSAPAQPCWTPCIRTYISGTWTCSLTSLGQTARRNQTGSWTRSGEPYRARWENTPCALSPLLTTQIAKFLLWKLVVTLLQIGILIKSSRPVKKDLVVLLEFSADITLYFYAVISSLLMTQLLTKIHTFIF